MITSLSGSLCHARTAKHDMVVLKEETQGIFQATLFSRLYRHPLTAIYVTGRCAHSKAIQSCYSFSLPMEGNTIAQGKRRS